MILNRFKYIFLRYVLQITTPKKLILFAVKKHGSKVVLIDRTNRVTLDELNRNVNRLCNGLLNLGIRKGDCVGILLQNCKEYIEIRLACYKCGFVFCALIDDFTPAQITETLHETKCRVFIYDNRLTTDNLLQLTTTTRVEFYIPIDNPKTISDYQNLIKNSSHLEPRVKIKPDEISAIGFTSGTTGKNKGIIWTHKAWLYSFYNMLINSDFQPASGMVILHIVPFSTAGSLAILPALASGAKNILMRTFDVLNIADTIDREKVTNLILPPGFLIELWDFYVNNKHRYNFKSLKNISVGSEMLPGNKWKEMILTFGPIIQQSYGMAEVLAPLASLRILEPEAEKNKLTSVGKVIKQVKLKLQDPESAHRGIICLQSKTCASGYLGNEKLTRQHFQNGWFVTGDIGCLDKEGNLYIIERDSNIFIHHGLKIIPREIEEIIHYFNGVKEVVVMKTDDELVAYLSARRKCQPDLIQLEQFCKENLPAAIVPSKYVLLDNLPRSTSGKILRKNLMDAKEILV